MEIIRTGIDDSFLITPMVYNDNRGSFFEMYNIQKLREHGIGDKFVQDNISISHKGVLRGVHTQQKYLQSKIVSCIKGTIYDVIVDCRPNSPTFKNWFGAELSGKNHKCLYVPRGVAHGYLSLADEALVYFKVSTHFHVGDEIGFLWNDSTIGIKWPLQDIPHLILADKDRHWGTFDEMMESLSKSI